MFTDPHRPYMWLLYVAVLTAYSLAALGISLDGSRSRILSARNIKPRGTIIVIHILFLGALFDLLLLTTHLYWVADQAPYAWLTMRLYRSLTPLDCALLVVGYVMVWVEQRLIYVDAKTGKSDLPGDYDYY